MQLRANELTPLQRAMREKGVSRLELALAVGVDPSTIWRWETGGRPNSQATRRAVAQALERTIDELFPAVAA